MLLTLLCLIFQSRILEYKSLMKKVFFSKVTEFDQNIKLYAFFLSKLIEITLEEIYYKLNS